MEEIVTIQNVPSTNLVKDALLLQRNTSPPSATILRLLIGIIRVPHSLVQILFPSTVFVNFFMSSVIPPAANIIIPMFFTGNILEKSALAVSSQYMFISIVLKVIQEGVGNSLFHIVGAQYKVDIQLAISAFKLSLLVLFFGGILLTVAIMLFTQQFVDLIDTPETISEATKHFFYTSAFSFVPTLFTSAFTNYLLISTSSWLVVAQLVIVLTTFLVNFFTFGRQSMSLHWGIDEFGIYTVVHSTVTMVVSFVFVLLVEKMGPISFFMQTSFREDLRRNFRKFFSVSWGNFADSIVRNFFYFFVTLKFVNHLGEDSTAAWNLFNGIIWGIILLPAFVVANYIRVRIGHNSSKSTIKEVTKESGISLMAWIIVMVILSGTIWSPLASFFSRPNPKVVFMSESLFHDLGWIFVVFAYNNAIHSFFLATGKTKFIFYQSLATNSIVYFIPWILHLFDIITPTYWWILGLYVAGMLTNCCLTTYFGVIVWKSIPDMV